MSDKLEQYADILDRLVAETVACTPQDWTKGTLTIESDGTYVNYKLKNPDEPGAADISEKLRDLIDELCVRMARRGDSWTEAKISFFHDGADLKFNAAFEYAGNAPQETRAESRPWWRFW